MDIGSLHFGSHPVFLAPMEDVTDQAFRLMCKKFGADMVYTEFVSSDALIRAVNRTQAKLSISDEERPVAIQIYGKDIDTMVEAARICEAARPDIIDLNFGCPVRKVAGKGAGAGLLQDIPRMLAITTAVVKAVSLPVTVKTRLGWDDTSRCIVDLAERLQDCGIAALTIHGRTRAQMYTGTADWTLIGRVKDNPRMHIPIIGNGDITTPEQAGEAFGAAIGHPWIFEEVKHYLDTGSHTAPKTMRQCIDILKNQALQSIGRLDERRGIIHIRRHLAMTPAFKGIPGFRETRVAMLRTESADELFAILDSIADRFGTR